MRYVALRARWFLGGCVACLALFYFIQGMLLWKFAELLQSDREDRT